MGISKPFYRIARPKAYIPDYVTDKRYASDRLQLSRAYINIEKDLRQIFDYIEPGESNKDTFSLELYSLLLRACTEVELNCKLILEANGASPKGNSFNMKDYMKLEKSSLLSKYTIIYPNWRKKDSNSCSVEHIRKEYCPFASFSKSMPKSPDWYRDYNEVKHNREGNFEKATLENCMNAVAGVLILLYSQFGSQCIETYGTNGISIRDFDNDYDAKFDANVIFEIHPPKLSDWSSDELYDFDWNMINSDSTPFEKFDFNYKKEDK